MSPDQIAKPGTEHAHQAALFCWANQNVQRFPELRWMHAIPNGGSRDPITAGKLKAEGVKAGVSDIFLPVARHGFHGLYIELKKPNLGNPTKEQLEFQEFVQSQGFACEFAYGWEQAVWLIETYMI